MRHAPTLNGTVEGSIQQLAAENTTLNGGATISGNLLVPGTPTVRLNGKPNYGGTIEGTGAASPSNYTITLNGNATLAHVVRRTSAITLPVVTVPPQPTGNRSVSLNKAGQSPGDFTTLRHLTLNSNVGPITVPPGAYGNLIANGGSGFVLGTTGALQPAIYNLQNLTLNSNSSIAIIGPVIVTTNSGFSLNGSIGSAAHPEWLQLRVAGGGVSVNGNVSVYGRIEAPAGTVTLNGNSRLTGAVASDRLIVNGGSLLRLVEPTSNRAPSVTLSSTPAGAAHPAPASLILNASASDPDGTVVKVEFFQNGTKIGDDTIAPYTHAVSGLSAGSYAFLARTTDDSGATTDSTALMVTVTAPNQPPTVELVSPPDGSLHTEPAAFTLVAVANDLDGGVGRIEFYHGATKIGEDFTAPFELPTTGLTAGTYTFFARALDHAGATATSAPVTLTVIRPNQLPHVTISSPVDGSTFTAPASFTLAANATDADGTVTKVEFFDRATKVGESAVAPFQIPITNLGAGTYTYFARAYDDAGGATDSASVTIAATSANLAPTVALTVPPDGAIFTTPAQTITLTASANDDDGSIAMVEFYEGVTKIGEVTRAPYSFVWENVLPGSYLLTARAYDDKGATTTSAPVALTVRVGLPYFTSFETSEGLTLGPLTDQAGWATTGRADVSSALSLSGQNSVLLAPSTPPSQASHAFPPYGGQSVVFLDLFARPAAGLTPAGSVFLETETARVAFVRSGDEGEFQVFNGDGLGSGVWQQTGTKVPIGADAASKDWLRMTLREDFSAKRWDLYVSNRLVAHDLGSLDNAKALFGQFTFNGHPTIATAFDDFYLGFENPLFSDADKDGMDDAWETAHGLNPSLNERTSDPDGDGRANFQECWEGTDPNDYYDGSTPTITPLSGGDGRLSNDGALAVQITSADSNPMGNAPVVFTVASGGGLLSAPAESGQLAASLLVRTGSDGIVRVFYREPESSTTSSDIAVQAGNASLALHLKSGAPNAPPTVKLNAPLEGARLSWPGILNLLASAADTDGRVVKVEFFANETKVGEATSAPYRYEWNPSSQGEYSLIARATDDSGVSTLSAPVALVLEAAEATTLRIDFEAEEGYKVGSISGQLDWKAGDNGAYVEINPTAPSGESALRLDGGGSVSRAFPESLSEKVVFLDFYARFAAGSDSYSSVQFEAGGAKISLVADGVDAEVWAGYTGYYSFSFPTGVKLSVDSNQVTREWHRFTMRLDYGSKTWDLYVDNARAMAKQYLGSSLLDEVRIYAHTTNASWLDSLQILHANPSLPDEDVDGNGLSDTWELRYFGLVGVDPEADPDCDWLANRYEHSGNTDPTAFDRVVAQFSSVDSETGEMAYDGSLRVNVTTPAGYPLVSVPVTFRAQEGGHLLTDQPRGRSLTAEVTVFSDGSGTAVVYVRAASAQK